MKLGLTNCFFTKINITTMNTFFRPTHNPLLRFNRTESMIPSKRLVLNGSDVDYELDSDFISHEAGNIITEYIQGDGVAAINFVNVNSEIIIQDAVVTDGFIIPLDETWAIRFFYDGETVSVWVNVQTDLAALDSIAPTFSSAETISTTEIAVTMSEDLDQSSVPNISAFVLRENTGGGFAALALSAIDMIYGNGNQFKITSVEIAEGSTLRLDYTQPENNSLQDQAFPANKVNSVDDVVVTNNIQSLANVVWINASANAVVSGNNLDSSSASNFDNAYAQVQGSLAGEGSLQAQAESNTSIVIGFKTTNVAGAYTTFNFGLVLNDGSGNYRRIVNGALTDLGVSYVAGDIYRLYRDVDDNILAQYNRGAGWVNLYNFGTSAVTLYLFGDVQNNTLGGVVDAKTSGVA